MMKGRYTVECVGADGRVKWRERFYNVIMTAGKNAFLDASLAGSNYTVNGPFIGLIAAAGYVSGPTVTDTLASHAGWFEAGSSHLPQYAGARPVAVWSPAFNGAKALSTFAQFPQLTSGAIKGCFIVFGAGASSVIDSTGGVLLSAGLFASGDKSVTNGDTLSVSYTMQTHGSIFNDAIAESGSAASTQNFISAGQNTTPFRNAATNQLFSSLQAAHNAANNGDTIKVAYSATPYVLPASGVGVNPICNFTKSGLTVEWATPGLMPVFDVSAYWQQANQFGNADATLNMAPSCTGLTVRGLDITGFQVPGTGRVAFLNIESGYPYAYPNSVAYTALVEFCAMRKFTNGCSRPQRKRRHHASQFADRGLHGRRRCRTASTSVRFSTLHVEGCTFRTTANLGFIQGVGQPGDPKYGHLMKSPHATPPSPGRCSMASTAAPATWKCRTAAH
jgi:hypothetical protein